MKTILGLLFGSTIIFVVGATTYPKTKRVYNCSKWKPTDYITIPVNHAKNDLNEFKQRFEVEKELINENFKIISEMKAKEVVVDTFYVGE